jgi:hypothetical protein
MRGKSNEPEKAILLQISVRNYFSTLVHRWFRKVARHSIAERHSL